MPGNEDVASYCDKGSLSVTLTTASANVRIAPNGSILDSASSYDIVDAYGYHELIGFRYADGDITYWCVFKK